MTQQPQQGTELLYALIGEIRQHADAIVLGRGDPDFDTPAHIIAAAQEAMRRHADDVAPPEGILPLRQAIAARVKRVNDLDVDPVTEVVVTNGGQEGVFLMVAAVMGAGEALIVPEPNYNTYQDALAFAGGRRIVVNTSPADSFRVHPTDVREAITPQTKALLLVSPNNPTAGVIGREDAQAFVALAQQHDLIILADDIYDHFVYDDIEHVSLGSLPGAADRTLTINALSKAYSMTGWRLGWVVGPAPLMARIRQLKAAATGGTAIISQYAGLAALTGPQAPLKGMQEAYQRRRRIVLDALDEMGLPYGVPQGGQFVFADISQTGLDSAELAWKMVREQHVLAYPGSAFSPDRKNYLRMTFLQPEAKLREGLQRMKLVLADIA